MLAGLSFGTMSASLFFAKLTTVELFISPLFFSEFMFEVAAEANTSGWAPCSIWVWRVPELSKL